MNEKIYVVKTSPKTVLKDYKKLMHMAKYQDYFKKNEKIIIKLNLSWSKFFPACNIISVDVQQSPQSDDNSCLDSCDERT